MIVEFANMIDELCKIAKEEDWTVMIEINAYDKKEPDRVMAGAACQIHSLRDIFRLFTGDEENKLMKLLDKRIRKKLR